MGILAWLRGEFDPNYDGIARSGGVEAKLLDKAFEGITGASAFDRALVTTLWDDDTDSMKDLVNDYDRCINDGLYSSKDDKLVDLLSWGEKLACRWRASWGSQMTEQKIQIKYGITSVSSQGIMLWGNNIKNKRTAAIRSVITGKKSLFTVTTSENNGLKSSLHLVYKFPELVFAWMREGARAYQPNKFFTGLAWIAHFLTKTMRLITRAPQHAFKHPIVFFLVALAIAFLPLALTLAPAALVAAVPVPSALAVYTSGVPIAVASASASTIPAEAIISNPDVAKLLKKESALQNPVPKPATPEPAPDPILKPAPQQRLPQISAALTIAVRPLNTLDLTDNELMACTIAAEAPSKEDCLIQLSAINLRIPTEAEIKDFNLDTNQKIVNFTLAFRAEVLALQQLKIWMQDPGNSEKGQRPAELRQIADDYLHKAEGKGDFKFPNISQQRQHILSAWEGRSVVNFEPKKVAEKIFAVMRAVVVAQSQESDSNSTSTRMPLTDKFAVDTAQQQGSKRHSQKAKTEIENASSAAGHGPADTRAKPAGIQTLTSPLTSRVK